MELRKELAILELVLCKARLINDLTEKSPQRKSNLSMAEFQVQIEDE